MDGLAAAKIKIVRTTTAQTLFTTALWLLYGSFLFSLASILRPIV
jgi:hypothetical protein